MKQIIFDLKPLTHVKAGIGRYCINLTSHLLKRNKYRYFGIMGPESDTLLANIESKKHLNIQSSLIRSYLLAFSLPKNLVKLDTSNKHTPLLTLLLSNTD